MTIARTQAGPGRPSKLDKKLADKICRLLERGNPVTVVCDLVGIHSTTYYDWLERGADAEEAGSDSDPFFLFSYRVKASQAKAEEKALRIVMDAAVGGRKSTKTVTKRKYLVSEEPDPDWGPGSESKREIMETDRVLLEEETTTTTEEAMPDARMAAWFLERRNRKDFGRTVGLTSGDGHSPVKIQRVGVLETLDDASLDALEAILAGTGASAAADAGGSAAGEGAPEGQAEPG